MKLRNLLILAVVATVVGCKAPPPKMTDDTLVTSEINGVTLTHRYAVAAPHEFTPVNASYRALYPGSIMTKPDFGGKVVSTLENGQSYTVLGQVENNWLAIAEQDKQEMLGYVPTRALVKSELYAQTLKKDRPRPRRAAKKTTCVAVDGGSKACQNANSGTWIID
ncbi:SH3 domain-containing protein [Buttiauxella selenatireducens]|uniref:SH3 domain-containing protein n=1 Tax=Buttiauxella selenatireducens TaxID=3073902 RepID=A0ABY9SIP5_9ENTR|nr:MULTISPECIES: SH3 domain-containing protein [unclassified Buttiauxella]WMY76296.1 SH3 domain-containing protein [Buttiauxella sp. R73]GDX04156.1 SH3 domain-containing protein [Buttiauxella sp. A111]